MRSDPLASAIAPGAGQCFRYLIYLDIVGSLADPAMQNALRHLQVRGLSRACIQTVCCARTCALSTGAAGYCDGEI